MKSFGKVLTFFVTLLLLALPFLVWFKAQALMDWWSLRDYTPPTEVVELADKDKLTDKARHIFYVNHPSIISDPAEFRQKCTQSEQTIVLGCYHSKQNGIDIYNVKDQRLSGVKEVTSAHEMLHAAYDRLSSKDKDYINGLLNNYYQNELKDDRVLATVDSYKKLEPNDVVNEMHSIFGTEIKALPQPLESYYKQYFSDRSAVVGFAENYENEFATRLDSIKKYDSQLADLKLVIDQEESALNSQLVRIEAERRRLESMRTSGHVQEYNASVSGFNSLVNAYNNQVSKLKADITTYNRLVEERNAVAQEVRALDQALDTRLVPEAAQ